MIFPRVDIVVIGGGHAGAEAAAAAARLNCSVMLITQMLDHICQMSCNPAMGGVAKGQIVREIDALGGWSGIITDRSAIQFRMLNRSKGPAMWSPRAQCDRMLFSASWRAVLESVEGIQMWQDEVVDIIIDDNAVKAVQTRMGTDSWQGGRVGESPANGLSDKLKAMGFEVSRLKTGTPVRVDGRTIDFSRLAEQPGDAVPERFSFTDTPLLSEQRPCYLAYTNNQTHDILRTGFDRSPMFTGRIQGRGPRYCPSIEDKIDRFADKDHHQLFVEPEGWKTQSYYLNGFSSSLPLDVQLAALHSIEGFEQARVMKPGYAIEYDYFPPVQLSYTLETKRVENLYFAGQVNGTTGYEEAACQGLMAGINAALKLKGKSPLVLSRSQAYIGVLIDDLVSKGVDEPYRMFTSRAEYRILLRQDNADQRLTPLGHAIGLASDERMRRLEQKMQQAQSLMETIDRLSVVPSDANARLAELGSATLSQRMHLGTLLLRPELSMEALSSLSPELKTTIEGLPAEVVQEVEITLKYQRYIEKEQEVASRLLRFEDIKLPSDFDYFTLTALSYEGREKLTRQHPATLGQASRISGVSPADISLLLLKFGSVFHEKH